MLTSSERRVRERVASLVRELLDEKELTYRETGLPSPFLWKVLCDTEHDLRLTTVVKVAEALNCDVVIHFRQRG